ncbi:methylenetetrahydrofolate reductase [uncultured Amnibacterium sp.]|uniref:methylenetetrahydrofolate reductase n=1 Tax=uncultured Amnibacterium sp. TaxID=1631851 RepID=UPI0035CAB466
MVAARVPHSFELYPPRSAATAAALPSVVDALAATEPAWFSVTYGAAGSTTEASYDVARLVLDRTDVDVMAHLTCVGSSHAEAAALVQRFLAAGVRRFLAIRGDLVEGRPLGDIHSAAELVQLVHRVLADREQWAERAVPEARGVRTLHVQPPRADVTVAAFVNGHPDSRTPTDHLDALLAKQVAGAEMAITQLFFHTEDYVTFVEQARRWGITIPIVPGILPITSPARLRRMLELSGEDEPRELAVALDTEPTVEGRREVGIAHAARFANDLIAAGAPVLHLYTFNQAGAVLDVLHRIGFTPAPTKETT